MIHGIGTDICQIPRIAQALARHGERFARRILGPDELARAGLTAAPPSR